MASENVLEITRGKSLKRYYGWGSDRLAYREIQAATSAAPCILHVPSHGMPEGWLFDISGAKGLSQLNTVDPQDPDFRLDMWPAIIVDADHIELNSLNAANMPAYEGGGWVQYPVPEDISNHTARAQFRDSYESTEVLLELTSDPGGGLIITPALSRITWQMTALQTAGLPDECVFDIELTSPSGEVDEVDGGKILLCPESTR